MEDTSTANDLHPASTRAEWRMPRLRNDDRVIGGVASGIAEEIGVPPLFIRGGFIVLATTVWGILLYGVMWAGLAIHDHQHAGVADEPREPKAANATARMIGVGLVFAGMLLAARVIDIGFEDAIVWPAALLVLGMIVAWDRGVLESDGEDRSHTIARIVVGLGLALAGPVLLVSSNLDRGATLTVVVAIVVIGLGLALVVGPWVWRTLNDLADERRRRIRSEERADVAAHLHDSVLQTLALIQHQSDDPAAMVSLARRQERELRDWLFSDDDPVATTGTTFRRSITDAAAAVEEIHHVPIDVVAVGDLDMSGDDRLAAMVAATREAMSNAARHSGTGSIDVYAEVSSPRVEVFVRDTGTGFDPSAVAEDRRGIADSIEGRMRRVGGWAIIESTAGHGTEIAMGIERRADG